MKVAVKTLRNKILNKTATYDDAVALSKVLGDVTSKYLVSNGLPDEMLGEYASEVLAPIYRSMQNTTLGASKEVQKLFNEKMGVQLNPVNVPSDERRITHIVARFRDAESKDTVSFLVEKGVAENIARGSVTDSLRSNAKALDDAGFETTVTRSGAGCCAWCDAMTGTYKINDIPTDFWRVHKACTCSFTYNTRNKRTRITYSTGDDGKMTKNTEDI